MKIEVLSEAQAIEGLKKRHYEAQSTYLAMYSSWLGGIVKDPALMFVPVDDHMVHRGDGVFEAMKVIGGNFYLLDQHLERLFKSSSQLSINTKYSKSDIADIIKKTWQVAGLNDSLIRLFLSRGPGTFSTNPYDSIGEQLYVVITKLAKPSEQKYKDGVKIGRSLIPPKDPWFARIKSCNYLQNVLMKKEAVDRQLDFTIGLTKDGFVTEGSTENLILVKKNGDLVMPKIERILRGTTMIRVSELGQKLVSEKKINAIKEVEVTEQDLIDAREIMMVGTTLDVLPVVQYENHKISNGVVGPIAQELLKLLIEDMNSGPIRA